MGLSAHCSVRAIALKRSVRYAAVGAVGLMTRELRRGGRRPHACHLSFLAWVSEFPAKHSWVGMGGSLNPLCPSSPFKPGCPSTSGTLSAFSAHDRQTVWCLSLIRSKMGIKRGISSKVDLVSFVYRTNLIFPLGRRLFRNLTLLLKFSS